MYSIDLTLEELQVLRELVREHITRVYCPDESRILDELFNSLNRIDKRVTFD